MIVDSMAEDRADIIDLYRGRPLPLVNYRATVWTDRLAPRGRVET